LSAYLKAEPNDRKIRLFLTRIWVDSGKHVKALGFWEEELKANPKNIEILTTLSEINRQAGDYDKSLEWMGQRVDAEPSKEGKVQGLLAIARIQFSRLRREDLIDAERMLVADQGLAALKKAELLMPNSREVHGHLASLYLLRGFSHGAYWAFAAEQTTQRLHFAKISELNKAEKAAAAATGTAPANAEDDDNGDELELEGGE